ncbi:hypothetical protein Sa4125_29540 [Aureimonas sp. SA4125]|nr:hypothetical protein Sa4125_29540 [Aureimonas sp. SA4125]
MLVRNLEAMVMVILLGDRRSCPIVAGEIGAIAGAIVEKTQTAPRIMHGLKPSVAIAVSQLR